MSEKAEILTKCLEKEIAKNPKKAINIFPFTNNVALDVICGNKFIYHYNVIFLGHKVILFM